MNDLSCELLFRRLTYHALQLADQETVQDLTGLVTVSDIFEGLGAVLATDVEEDFLTTTVVEGRLC